METGEESEQGQEMAVVLHEVCTHKHTHTHAHTHTHTHTHTYTKRTRNITQQLKKFMVPK